MDWWEVELKLCNRGECISFVNLIQTTLFVSHCTEYVNTVLPMEQSCHCYDVYHAWSPHCDDCFV